MTDDQQSEDATGVWRVERGDTMVSIAEATGHFWRTLWNDPANAELKADRADPNVLQVGDLVTTPALRHKTAARDVDLVHRFKRKGVPVDIQFQARRRDGSPFADKRYVLRVGKRRYEGRTDDQGMLRQFVSPAAKTGLLTIWLEEAGYPKTYERVLNIGSLQPIENIAGVQARLKNLNYYRGALDGQPSETLEKAVAAFQRRVGLDATGQMNSDTRDALLAAHGR